MHLFVCYETSGFDLAPIITQSSDDRHRDPWSVDHRREIHGSLEETHGYLLVFTFPPSMFGCLCSVVRCFKAYVSFFLKKQVRNRKNMKFSANRWELKINKDCENSQSL